MIDYNPIVFIRLGLRSVEEVTIPGWYINLKFIGPIDIELHKDGK